MSQWTFNRIKYGFDAGNQWTDAIAFDREAALVVTGGGDMAITLQARVYETEPWVDVFTVLGATDGWYKFGDLGGEHFRVGVRAGEYVSGACEVVITKRVD
jgi:hypothetical protein